MSRAMSIHRPCPCPPPTPICPHQVLVDLSLAGNWSEADDDGGDIWERMLKVVALQARAGAIEAGISTLKAALTRVGGLSAELNEKVDAAELQVVTEQLEREKRKKSSSTPRKAEPEKPSKALIRQRISEDDRQKLEVRPPLRRRPRLHCAAYRDCTVQRIATALPRTAPPSK